MKRLSIVLSICLSTGTAISPTTAVSGEILDALEKTDLVALQDALDQGCDPNLGSIFSGMPLHNAARAGWREGVRALFDAGANPIADDGTGTAIAAAAESDQLEILKYLAAEKIDLLAPDDAGKTPLHAAALAGATNSVAYLLDMGGQIEARMLIRGETPLHLAAREGNLDVVELLLSRGASPSAIDTDYDQTALHFAVRSGDLPTIQKLISAGSPLNAVNDNGATALDLARSKGQSEVIEYLESIGAKSAR